MTATSVLSSAIPALPNPVLENIIFPYLLLPELGACSRVCKVWREMAKIQINAFSHPHAFGPKEWFSYFGAYLRNIPRLPLNIAEIINSPCPFWLGKKVHETHLLVLIPETVGGQPLTLKTLGEQVQKTLLVCPNPYRYCELGECPEPAAPPSHWVLMTRDVIEGSRNKSYHEQQMLLSQKGHGLYAVPTIMDAAVCIFMEFVRSKTRLYVDVPNTYTRCQEKYDANRQMLVGGFGEDSFDFSGVYPGGLDIVGWDGSSSGFRGIGGCRKL